jgi:hypothetical protein
MPIEAYGIARRQQPLTPLAGSGRGLWGKHSAQTLRKLRDEWSRFRRDGDADAAAGQHVLRDAHARCCEDRTERCPRLRQTAAQGRGADVETPLQPSAE